MAEISIESIVEMLELMKDYRYSDKVVNPWIWDMFIEYIKDCFDGFSDEQKSILYLIDNFFINGSYGKFEDYMKSGEKREDFIKRATENGWLINTDNDLVIEFFGV